MVLKHFNMIQYFINNETNCLREVYKQNKINRFNLFFVVYFYIVNTVCKLGLRNKHQVNGYKLKACKLLDFKRYFFTCRLFKLGC